MIVVQTMIILIIMIIDNFEHVSVQLITGFSYFQHHF